MVGLSFLSLFAVAVAFLAANASILRAMDIKVRSAQRQAAEATKPAEVELTAVVAPDCANCYDIGKLTGGIKASSRVKVTGVYSLNATAPDGAAMIERYQLSRLPALVVKGEAEKLLSAIPQLSAYGELRGKDFVVGKVPPPYLELPGGKLRGAFSATYITERQCNECYDPLSNRTALQQLGLTPAQETTVDRSDAKGRALVQQYQLTTTPAVILTGDLAAYEGFDKIWQNVGTIEPDGTYVFRNLQGVMGTYYDLTTKKAVAPPTTKTNTNANTNTSHH